MTIHRLCSPVDAVCSLVEDRLHSGDLVHFHIRTGSMTPCLKPGDTVSVVGAPVEQVSVGALVVLRRGDIWIVHRLLRCSSEGDSWKLLTKGDRTSICDSIWKRVDRVGVVRTIQRGERRFDLTGAGARLLGRTLAALSACEARLLAGSPGRLRCGLGRFTRLGLIVLARGGYGG